MSENSEAERPEHPPGHQLVKNLIDHHTALLKGVMEHFPLLEHEPTIKAVKKYCMKCHKSADELVNKCSDYGIKNCDMPSELMDDKDEGLGSSDNNSKDELDEEENLDLNEEEKKMFLQQIEALETQDEAEELFILQHKGVNR